jgi:hypothetical protein
MEIIRIILSDSDDLISGDFSVKGQIGLGSGYINGVFPVKQSEMTHFDVF